MIFADAHLLIEEGGSENVGLSNANRGENPMPRNPKGSSSGCVYGGQGLRSGGRA